MIDTPKTPAADLSGDKTSRHSAAPADDRAQNMAENAAEAAAFLKTLSNEKRLLVLCRLIEVGEASVGALAGDVGLSQSALSQHLALLRDDGLVGTRRDGQTVFYRISDARVEQLVMVLHDIFCPPDTADASSSRPLSSSRPPSSSRKGRPS